MLHARSQLNNTGNQIGSVTLSSQMLQSNFLSEYLLSVSACSDDEKEMGVPSQLTDVVRVSRHLRREWRCRQLLMASSNLHKLISTHPRASHLLSTTPCSSSSPPKLSGVEISTLSGPILAAWSLVWERRTNLGRRKRAYYTSVGSRTPALRGVRALR